MFVERGLVLERGPNMCLEGIDDDSAMHAAADATTKNRRIRKWKGGCIDLRFMVFLTEFFRVQRVDIRVKFITSIVCFLFL